MRYLVILILVASVVALVIISDQFPSVLARYPFLLEAGDRIRAWLGLGEPRSVPISEKQLKETEKLLRKEAGLGRGGAKKKLAEYPE